MGENSPVLWEGDEPMEQKKRIWWTFQLWEADAFRQYLEEMALKGWFLESVGGAVMKFHKGQPEKRRYVVLLVPESSSLTGTDDWKAGQLRQQCEEAGWKVQCSSTYWQIFYTTDDAVKRVGDMKEEKQFQLQRSLSWNWWVKIFYPILVVLEIWSVYRYLQNPGKLFADSMKILLILLLIGMSISWTVSYVQMFRWSHGNTVALKKGEPLPKLDFKRIIKCKKHILLSDVILILGVVALAFLSSVKAQITFMLSLVLMLFIALFVRKWVRKNGSGDNRDDWVTYLVGVGVAYMILIPLCNGVATHFLGEEELETGRKQTIFASYEEGDFRGKSIDKPIGVTVYTSPIPWIINKTSECYPKDMTRLWEQIEMEVPAEVGALPEDVEVFWYRYMVCKNGIKSDPEENDIQRDAAKYDPAPAMDEVILKDKRRLVVLNYGGGTDLARLKEAVDAFMGGNGQ